MKKINFSYVVLGLLLLAACKKNDGDIPIPPGHLKDYVLKKMVYGTMQYTFYYNKKWMLDSIGWDNVKEKGVYRIIRRNNRIDSVLFINNGRVRSYHARFEYDNDGNITRYISDGVPGGPFPYPTVITYQQGHVRSITTYPQYPPTSTMYDTLIYNQQDNVTRWATSMQRSSLWDVKWFTYDNRYNPLYFIEDLLVIFTRGPLAELHFSKHNSTSKFYELDNITVNYQNYYDNKQRLIKKVFTERYSQQPDTVTFHYMR